VSSSTLETFVAVLEAYKHPLSNGGTPKEIGGNQSCIIFYGVLLPQRSLTSEKKLGITTK
jgi:hypothetical protein